MKLHILSRLIVLAAICLAASSSALAQTFSNGSGITINDGSTASPYPSTITVSGVSGTISDINVTISNINHPFPDDIGLLLVGPTGVSVRLMVDAGGGLVEGFTNVTLTFDDAALTAVPDEGPVPSGSYKPTTGTQDLLSDPHPANFAAPAPSSPYGTVLAAYNGTLPNGAWNLYVDDDTMIDGGSIDGGWSLSITGAIPEPSTWMLLSFGITALVVARVGKTLRR